MFKQILIECSALFISIFCLICLELDMGNPLLSVGCIAFVPLLKRARAVYAVVRESSSYTSPLLLLLNPLTFIHSPAEMQLPSVLQFFDIFSASGTQPALTGWDGSVSYSAAALYRFADQ